MINYDYLHKGICALANAHRAGTMAGHLGAAVTAGYFFGEDQSELPPEVYAGIEQELDRVIAGEESFWYNVKKAMLTPTELFNPLPEAESTPAAVKTIAKTLQQNVGQTRQSGHNVIFASNAIRVLHDHPEFATSEIINGLCKLTAGFNSAHAGRGYYGKEKGWLNGDQVSLSPDANFPPYNTLPDMVDVTMTEFLKTAHIKKQGFGGWWHIINHTAAIIELDRYGYHELSLQALPAHHQHIQLWRTLPDVEAELGPVEKSIHHPHEAIYWETMFKRDEARLTHRVKTLYGFDVLIKQVQNEEVRMRAEEAFLYLMA